MAISPQPGPSRESTSTQSSPTKRKGRSPEHRIETLDKIDDDSSDLHRFEEDDDDEEDDITLQDLVALETMDDADELDMNSEPSLQNDSESFENSNSSQIMARKTSISGNQIGVSSGITTSFRTEHFGIQHLGTSLQSYPNALNHTKGKLRSKLKDILLEIIYLK